MNKMYISIFSFAFKILIPLNWEFFYVNIFKPEGCRTYFLTFKPHLKHKGNFNTYMTELMLMSDCQWGLRPVFIGFFSPKYLSQFM